MPDTTVQKMIGAITILISLMKPSPSALTQSFWPKAGNSQPNIAPSTMASSTCTYKILYQGFAGLGAATLGVTADVTLISFPTLDHYGRSQPFPRELITAR